MLIEIVERVVDHMERTLFYFVESTLIGLEARPVQIMMNDEIRIMLLNDIFETYALTVPERQYIAAQVSAVIEKRVIRLASKPMKGGEGSMFMMHTVVLPVMGTDPNFHHADTISVTAGIGKRDWDTWTPREQIDIRDFMFDLSQQIADPLVPFDIKIKNGRLTTVIPVKEVVKN